MDIRKKVINKKKKKKKKEDLYELYLNMYEDIYRNREEITEKGEGVGIKKSSNDANRIDLEKEVKLRLEEQSNLLSIKGIDRVDIKQKKGKHSIICIHYIKNMCMKNLFCNYLHQLIYDRIPPCKNYIKYNYCSDKIRGSCMFRHTLENTNTNYYSENKEESLDEALKFLHEKNICVNYLLGFCNLGYNCRKIHKNRSIKYLNIINILPKFYLDQILINKNLYTNLYKNQQVLNDMNKLKDALIVLSGEKYQEKNTSLTKNDRENSLSDMLINSDNNYKDMGSSRILNSGTNIHDDKNLNRSVDNINGDHINITDGNLNMLQNNNENMLQNNDPNNIKGVGNIPEVYNLDNTPVTSDKIKVFVIKCNQISNLYLSILYGVWATGKNNTRKYMNFFKENYTIIFLFSVNESGGFQGYAKMVTTPIKNLYENLWGPITNRLGGNFRVQWIKIAKIDFDVFKNITNPYNDNLPLKKSRDGTELPLNIASIICNKIHALPNEDFLAGTIYEYKRRINHSVYFTNLYKKNMLNTNTMWDSIIFTLNQKSDCQQITYIDGNEQNIS
ncbi:YTH domain-containing protein, putative [Plasmodium chabaudi chabaudi]|uniref:YTH domain-containing protein, putative n=2 Tax=Plasmodium chabaudi chabaudi TaxID=31271 RepID=A0A1C6XF41_PLACU|nr:YTH domain-containing protein, putative [Plasmodium chabaudi chabaudi]